jgi:hypothetical protein
VSRWMSRKGMSRSSGSSRNREHPIPHTESPNADSSRRHSHGGKRTADRHCRRVHLQSEWHLVFLASNQRGGWTLVSHKLVVALAKELLLVREGCDV